MKSQHCKACGAPIIFLPTKLGKQNPVNAESVQPGDTTFDHTRHRSHFIDCPKAKEFRRDLKQVFK